MDDHGLGSMLTELLNLRYSFYTFMMKSEKNNIQAKEVKIDFKKNSRTIE